MSSPDLQTVVIACPNCGTRYQVPYGTIGAAGREVQCAQCSKPWHATADAPPPPAVIDEDRLFSPADERALDAQFEAEARTTAGHDLEWRLWQVAWRAACDRPLPAVLIVLVLGIVWWGW